MECALNIGYPPHLCDGTSLESGWVDAINDVAALSDEGAIEALAPYQDIGVCLMHMQGIPESMQHNPEYSDVTTEVVQYLQGRVDACLQAGLHLSVCY